MKNRLDDSREIWFHLLEDMEPGTVFLAGFG